MQGTSPEYRQRCVALAERLEDLHGQSINIAVHAIALALVAVALRREDSGDVLFDVHRLAVGSSTHGTPRLGKHMPAGPRLD